VDGAGAAWNEGDRLAALRSYGVLDTAPEPAFDCLVQLAAQVCGTPIAAINLIEDRRQWFKAEVGLGLRETPVEVSICARAILHRGPLIVPEMTQDARFACNPLVTGPPTSASTPERCLRPRMDCRSALYVSSTTSRVN